MAAIRRNHPKLALLTTCSAVAIAAVGSSAMAAPPPNCPTQIGGTDGIPVQTIQIFNDTGTEQIYAELEVGLNNPDQWIQMVCNVPDIDRNKNYPYPTTATNRFYINGLTGIPPGGSVTITLPLYTQLAETVVPTSANQYAEWWQGQNMQIFAAAQGSGAPESFKNYFNGTAVTRKNSQTAIVSKANNPTWPTCTGTDSHGASTTCTLAFVTDTAGTLPKYAPSQLVEATLGARQNKVPAPTDGSITTFLYPTQADFDVSYVNAADLAATMGPMGNDQAGYVGSPVTPGDFTPHLRVAQRMATLHRPRRHKCRNFKIGIAARAHVETERRRRACRYPPVADWPGDVWTPIQDLRTNWNTYAPPRDPKCHHGASAFCDALLDVRDLIHANYLEYERLFAEGKCSGEKVSETADLTLSHVYGWQPWTESKTGLPGEGCSPTANLLENTPGYGSEDKTYAKYAEVKSEFDNLNYGTYLNAPYVFNPWVTFIHGTDQAKGQLGMPGVYAYSVDDAVGNLNVYATGYIVDIGSTAHQENQNPAGPPIAIALGYSILDKVRFDTYSACGPNKDKKVNPADPVFIISSIDPENCPVYLTDNQGQTYTFTVKPTVTKPPLFTDIKTKDVMKVPSDASWSTGIGYPYPGKNPTPYNTTSIIDCSGNMTDLSKLWCCTRLAEFEGKGFGSGVFAYSTPQYPPTAHQLYENKVVTNPATGSAGVGAICNMGKP